MSFLKRAALCTLGTGLLLALLMLTGMQPALRSTASFAVAQEEGDQACLTCHSQPGMETTLPSGEVLYLTVDPKVYAGSVHGQAGLTCVHCHADFSEYPHPPLTAQTRRELSISRYRASCAECHADKYDATMDSVHQAALAAGDTKAAICTDCHGVHNIGRPDEPRSRASQMCELCHSDIFERYKLSVHGQALLGEGNPDVPGCVDCHQVHSVQGPSTSPFRLFSPELCAKCHADPQLMGKYGISTDVFDTYVADFHGTTVTLFQKLAPDQPTNKPVCIDCHGVHDMRKIDDPESTVIKENLLKTCQKCHPDASANFPTSWISHYRPSPENAALTYFVNLFYKIFIPVLLGGMGLYVITDAGRRIVDRRRKGKEQHHG